MIQDFVTLLRVEWKCGKADVVRWLKIIGYDSNGSRLYRVYFWLFWAFWLFAMWGFAVQQVYELSASLPASTISRLFRVIPAAIFALQLLYLIASLRDEPLKLREATLVYVAFSPVNRASIVILEFIRALIPPAVIIAVISCLLSMLLTWRSAPHQVGLAGLGALIAAILLVYLSAALVWSLALLKVQPGIRRFRWILWLSLPAAVIAAVLTPVVTLFPGYFWLRTANLSLAVADLAGFLAVFAASLAFLLLVGNRVHMTVIADASQTSIRLNRMGVIGRLYASDVIQQIQQQGRLARIKRPSARLSERATGSSILWNRAAISLRRRLPGSVFQPLIVGSALTLVITAIVRIGEVRSIQSWTLVLLILCVFRLKSVISLFWQDVTQPFLRQMIPPNNLALFISDAAYVILLNVVGSITVIGLQPWNTPMAVILLGLFGVTALGLGQALELVKERLIIHRRIPFEYTVILGGGAVIASGVMFHSAWVAAGALLLVNIILSVLLYNSHS